MEKVNAFYRLATPDCPVSVSYYSPLQVVDEPFFPQVNKTLCITLVKQGQVEIFIKEKTRILTAGDIFIIPPHQLHTFRTMTMDTRYVFLSVFPQLITMPKGHFFRRDFTEPLFQGHLQVPELIRPGEALYPALSATLQILDQQKEGSPEYTAQLFAAVISFCAVLMPHCTQITQKEAATTRAENAALACLSYIKGHYKEKITLQELADHVHLHPNYLCALFKERTGKTIFEYLERYRIRTASKLLRGTELSVARIAEKCGFGSVSFFSRKFRSLIGLSPLQYRKRFSSAEQQMQEEL